MEITIRNALTNTIQMLSIEKGWTVKELREAVSELLDMDEEMMSLKEEEGEVTEEESLNGFNETTELSVGITEGGEILARLRSLNITHISSKGIHVAFLEAAQSDNFTLCENLLICGVDPNHKDPTTGKTSLRVAAAKGHREVCELLLEFGADVNVVDNRGWTALHAAASWGRSDMCSVLLSHGSPIHAVCHSGKTPLHTASASEHYETCKLLISHGADVRATDKSGRDVLFYCSYKQGSSRLYSFIFRQMMCQSRVVDFFSRV